MIFRALVFTFLPTALELVAVCVILARAFHPRVSALVVATFVAYATWTIVMTRVGGRAGGSIRHWLLQLAAWVFSPVSPVLKPQTLNF